MLLNDEMQYVIFEIAKWARLLAVLGFIFSGIFGLIAVAMRSVFPVLVKGAPSLGTIPGGSQALSVSYFIIALVSFIFSLHLFRFASNAKDGITYNSDEQLTRAFNKLKSFFKLWGILVLVFVGLNLISILSGILGKGQV